MELRRWFSPFSCCGRRLTAAPPTAPRADPPVSRPQQPPVAALRRSLRRRRAPIGCDQANRPCGNSVWPENRRNCMAAAVVDTGRCTRLACFTAMLVGSLAQRALVNALVVHACTAAHLACTYSSHHLVPCMMNSASDTQCQPVSACHAFHPPSVQVCQAPVRAESAQGSCVGGWHYSSHSGCESVLWARAGVRSNERAPRARSSGRRRTQRARERGGRAR